METGIRGSKAARFGSFIRRPGPAFRGHLPSSKVVAGVPWTIEELRMSDLAWPSFWPLPNQIPGQLPNGPEGLDQPGRTDFRQRNMAVRQGRGFSGTQ